jgi:hypothetical protein
VRELQALGSSKRFARGVELIAIEPPGIMKGEQRS